MEQTLLYNTFNRFANYLEKNNSTIRIKIKNDDIMFNDQAYVFGDKYDDTHYISWFVLLVKKLPLDTQINWFFFGKNCESAKNSNIPLMVSIFEYCDNYLIDTYLMAPFGFPSCLEELAMKMDLMGI